MNPAAAQLQHPLGHHCAPARMLLYMLAFGLVWGVSLVMYGVAIGMVGMALTIAAVAGLSCLVGSLAPLIAPHPSGLLRPRGLLLHASIPDLFMRVGFHRKACQRREKEQSAVCPPAAATMGNFGVGLAVCIFNRADGSTINLLFASNVRLIRRSLELGASQATSTYPVWALVLHAGFVPNALWCPFLLSRNESWVLFREKRMANGSLARDRGGSIVPYRYARLGVGASLVGVWHIIRFCCDAIGSNCARQYLGRPCRRMGRHFPPYEKVAHRHHSLDHRFGHNHERGRVILGFVSLDFLRFALYCERSTVPTNA